VTRGSHSHALCTLSSHPDSCICDIHKSNSNSKDKSKSKSKSNSKMRLSFPTKQTTR
jgi:hypothetical protein